MEAELSHHAPCPLPLPATSRCSRFRLGRLELVLERTRGGIARLRYKGLRFIRRQTPLGHSPRDHAAQRPAAGEARRPLGDFARRLITFLGVEIAPAPALARAHEHRQRRRINAGPGLQTDKRAPQHTRYIEGDLSVP